MMRFQVVAIILLAGFCCPCFQAAAAPVRLPVQIERQPNDSNWCWAATSLALMNRYDIYPGVTIETGTGDLGQCLIAQKHPAHAAYDCCDSPEDCTSTATIAALEDIIEDDYGLDMTSYGNYISEASLITLLTAGKPVLVLRTPVSEDGHYWLVIGYDDLLGLFDFIEVLDGEILVRTYNEIRAESGYTWTGTLYPSTTPPDDVYLRYSYTDVNSEWTYNAPGDLVAGPDYNVYESTNDIIFKCGADDAISMKPGFWIETGANFLAVPQS